MATAQINGRAATAATEERHREDHAGLLDRVVEATRYTVRDVETMAARAARSRMYGLDESQAFCLMMIAESEGLHPIQALKRYHIIEGRPSMRADAMQAEFQRHGGRLRWVKTTAEECQAEAWHPTHHPERMTFTVTLEELTESRVACAWDREKREFRLKDIYRKYPRQMLRARLISEIVRAIDPGIVVGIYTPEELSDFASGDHAHGPEPDAPTATLERAPGPRLVHEGNNDPKAETVSEARRWLRLAIQVANDRLRNLLLIEGKGDTFQPVANEHQCVQWIVSRWIADGTLQEAEILKPDGRPKRDGTLPRDAAKVGAAVQVGWQQDGAEMRADWWSYLCDKAKGAAMAAGIEIGDEGVELPPSLAMTGQAEPADDAWEPGRE